MAPRGRSAPVTDNELTRLLRNIRDRTNLSGTDAGNRTGFSQSKISRWEKGLLVPTPEDADQYARGLGAPAADRRRLVAICRDFHQQHHAPPPARVGVSRSTAEHEKRVRRNEENSTRIAVFHPLLIPGALQTEQYVRALMSSGRLDQAEVEARIATRLERSKILNNPAHRLTFILTTGALGWRVGTPETMARQVEHLLDVSRLSTVRLGIIPWGVEVNVFPPCGFDLYDQHTAVVGVVGGAAYYNDSADVARYVDMLAALENLAVWDDDARAELRRLADQYRRLKT